MKRSDLPARFPPPYAVEDDSELAWLQRAARSGLTIAPMAVVPVAVETTFYQFNNLPEQLRRLYGGVATDDPDEDDLEELEAEAMTLVLGHTLLDEVIEGLFEALDGLPERLLVRRADADGLSAGRGRETLLAVKRVWADDWRADALAGRLREGHGLAPLARPLLVHTASLEREPEPLRLDGSPALLAYHDDVGRLARLTRRDA